MAFLRIEAVVSVILYRYTCWYNMFHLYLGLI